jgi:spermidine synthase
VIIKAAKTYLIFIGFASILGQTVILRELNVAFYGIELVYTLALGLWLLFSAGGTISGRCFRTVSISRLNFLFFLLSICIPADLAFIRASRIIFAGTPGAYLPLSAQMLLLTVSLLPMGFLLGLQFQWTARLYISKDGKLANAYALECLGGIAGGICATLFLKFGISNFVIALACAFLASIMPFANPDGKSVRRFVPFSGFLAAVWLLLLWNAHHWDRFLTSWTHPHLLVTRDSPYSRITATLLNKQVSVFENDSLIFDTESTSAEEFVHPSALQCLKPESVLILGGGLEGLLHEVQKHAPKIIDYVEINPVLLDTLTPYLPLEVQKSFHAPNIRLIIEDPRRYLRRAPHYDLILVGMPEPSSGQTNRYYTREFFHLCRTRLHRQGVLALRLRSSENLWTPAIIHRIAGIYRAAQSVFPQILFLPGTTNILMGSMSPLTTDTALLTSRMEARRLSTKLISPGYLRYLHLNDRFSQASQILKSSTSAINTDTRPICYSYTMLIWLSKFIPSITYWDYTFPEFRGIRAWCLSLLCILPLVLSAIFPWPRRRFILVTIIAFAGMVLETILLLHFQTQNGILYQDIGVLMTAFMAGLALGAAALGKLNRPITKRHGIILSSGFLLLSMAIGGRIQSGGNSGLMEVSVFLALAGLLTAGVFAYAGLRLKPDQNKALVSLYAADLLGGCLGSILTSLILAPLIGLSTTAFHMMGFAVFSLFLL